MKFWNKLRLKLTSEIVDLCVTVAEYDDGRIRIDVLGTNVFEAKKKVFREMRFSDRTFYSSRDMN